jgi:ABC-type branched-subunit amino acid transport system ATPase component
VASGPWGSWGGWRPSLADYVTVARLTDGRPPPEGVHVDCALLAPKILLIDEPSLGLDPRMVEIVFATIAEVNRAGTAVLMVEQNAKQALAISHRGFVLELGRNRFEGTGRALLENPDVRAHYLGG